MTKPNRPMERGQDIVEFALTLPILFLMLMGIFDMGRAAYFNSVLYNAAREGARYGVIFPDDTAGIENAVRTTAFGLEPGTLNITVVLPDEDTIQVSVGYQFTLVTPMIGTFFGGNQVTLANQATMRVEE